MFCTGSVEEIILRRQISKHGLGEMVVVDGTTVVTEYEDDEDLYSLDSKSPSLVHDAMACDRICTKECDGSIEDNMETWSHLHVPIKQTGATLQDPILENICKNADGKDGTPTFVMSILVDIKKQEQKEEIKEKDIEGSLEGCKLIENNENAVPVKEINHTNRELNDEKKVVNTVANNQEIVYEYYYDEED